MTQLAKTSPSQSLPMNASCGELWMVTASRRQRPGRTEGAVAGAGTRRERRGPRVSAELHHAVAGEDVAEPEPPAGRGIRAAAVLQAEVPLGRVAIAGVDPPVEGAVGGVDR